MLKKLTCTILTLLMLLPLVPLLVTRAEGADVTIDDIIASAAPIIRENEGHYHSVNANDNGALSIGWIQWHANRALSLLRTIVNANPTQAKDILGDSLYNEILTAQSWSTRTLNEDEARRVSSLISTEEGKKAQDDLAATDIFSYVNHAMALGITDPSALVYYSDIENQCGQGGAKRVANAAAELAGSFEGITLDILYRAALSDSIAGRYATRRQKTYNNCLLLDWSVIGTDLEVWDIKVSRNVRKTADTSSELVTSLAKGTKVIISEKVYFNGETRGRTSMGWITLDSESCTLNEQLSGGTVPAPVIFDLKGGTYSGAAKAKRTANGFNTSRGKDQLIVYNSSYAYKTTPTNAYGAEVTVDKSGVVISDPVYGTCKTTIPDKGFVISAIGSSYEWLSKNVKRGNYVIYDAERSAVYVYESYSSYTSTKKASGTATSLNTPRGSNALVIYDKSYGYSAPQTNPYGAEAAVDSTGKVISAPDYGTCKTPIPAGGLVISGIGSGYEWLRQSVSAGNYVHVDKASLSITVYESYDSYLSGTKTAEKGKKYGSLPVPSMAESEFAGWRISGTNTVITENTTCISPYTIILRATWASFEGYPVAYNTDGGSFSGIKTGMASGLNISRPANSLIVYDSSYALSAPQTNKYGAEIAVDKNGSVLSDPKYGTCKTPIPAGGFVISGIGSGYEWLRANITKSNYVSYDKASGVITVYKNEATYKAINKKILPGAEVGTLPEVTRTYHSFVGWYTASGVKVTESYVMPPEGISLTAKWEVLPGDLYFNADGGQTEGLVASMKLSGTDIPRGSNALVLYKDKASTGTNVYGYEAVIAKDGTVLAVYPYGCGNAKIPSEGYILSGHGSAGTMIHEQLKRGRYLVIENDTVYVWESAYAYTASKTTTVKFGEKYGALPTAAREGYLFKGWKDPNGTTVSEGSTVGLYGDITLTAVWEKLCTVTFDAGNGGVVSSGASAKASGINIHRSTNALVIYAGKVSTGTNIYGTEAVIDKDGTVITVYSSGKGNAPIPEGCIVLSGHGTMSTWIQNNLKAGDYVTVNGFNVSAYESRAAFDAADGKMHVKSGSPLGALPSATLSSHSLDGWFSGSTKYAKDNIITSDITLSAKWIRIKTEAIYDTMGGSFDTSCSTFKISAVNSSRPANSIALYDSGYR
ncbi:MAG: InlB B-repeat-containing protein, partial [Clostridia bacterium]|nr:InlB B-repeat-containing protein [Clostridia bacterium]